MKKKCKRVYDCIFYNHSVPEKRCAKDYIKKDILTYCALEKDGNCEYWKGCIK